MVGLGGSGKAGDRAYHAGPGGNDFIGIEIYVSPTGVDAETFASVVQLIVELQALYGYTFELIDHRSVAATSCGADIDVPAFNAAVSKAVAVVPTPAPGAPAPAPVTPPVATPMPVPVSAPVSPAPALPEPTVQEFIEWLYGEFLAARAAKK